MCFSRLIEIRSAHSLEEVLARPKRNMGADFLVGFFVKDIKMKNQGSQEQAA